MAAYRSSVRGQALALFAALSPIAVVAQQSAFPVDRVFSTYHHFNNSSEAVHLQLSLSGPGKSVRSNAVVTYDLSVKNADGDVVETFSIEAPIEGFAEVTLEAGDTASAYESGRALTNSVPISEVQSDIGTDRFSFRVDISPFVAGRNPQTGEPIPITAPPFLIVATTTFDKFSGLTRATTHTQYDLRQLGLAVQNFEPVR
jgi:hypothetical protein